MSDWHIGWQERFPEECREITLESNGNKHRADVLIDKTVLEFQHSHLSSDEFNDRNEFYTSLGYHVVWVFDFSEEWACEKMGTLGNSETKYYWKHPRATFNEFDCRDSKVSLFFQTQDEDDTTKIDALVSRITWVAPSGFERFATDTCMTIKEFLSLFLKNDEEKQEKSLSLSDLYDILPEGKDEGGDDAIFGCPLKSDGVVRYDECIYCKHNGGQGDFGFHCSGRFASLKFDKSTIFNQIERSAIGDVTSVTINEDGKKKKYDIPRHPIGMGIADIYRKYSFSIAILQNIESGIEVKVRGNLLDSLAKYHQIYGYIKKPGFDFSNRTFPIYGVASPVWIALWFRK